METTCFLHDSETGEHVATAHLVDIVPGDFDVMAIVEYAENGILTRHVVSLDDVSFCLRA